MNTIMSRPLMDLKDFKYQDEIEKLEAENAELKVYIESLTKEKVELIKQLKNKDEQMKSMEDQCRSESRKRYETVPKVCSTCSCGDTRNHSACEECTDHSEWEMKENLRALC